MIKTLTEIQNPVLPVNISQDDKVVVIGSCFADEIGKRLLMCGVDALVNPFGTLYNPASIASAVERMESGTPFEMNDCVKMGAGAELYCSFHHHTSFARETPEAFLEAANDSLEKASDFWRKCTKVIVTLGTAMVYRHEADGDSRIVSNCLKRPGYEFSHSMLSLSEVECNLRRICEGCEIGGREFILTVSPIRHLADGAQTNSLSKARLLLACEAVSSEYCCYFPSYEIMMDELRDYRYYAEDMVHPSKLAAEIIWDRFISAAFPQGIQSTIREQYRLGEKAIKSAGHRQMK